MLPDSAAEVKHTTPVREGISAGPPIPKRAGHDRVGANSPARCTMLMTARFSRCLFARLVLGLALLSVTGWTGACRASGAGGELRTPESRPGPVPTSKPLRLRPGQTVKEDLAPGEVRAWRIRLEAGDHLLVEARQQGVDLEVRLVDEGGRTVESADVLLGLFSSEILETIVEAGGEYRLEVEGLWNSPAGACELTVRARGPAGPGERARLAAITRAREAHRRCENPGPGRAFAEIRDLCTEAAERWQEVGDLDRAAENLNRLGRWMLAVGPDEGRDERSVGALAYYRQALELWRRSENPSGQASALQNIGTVYENLYRYQEAAEAYGEAVDLCRQAGDYRFEVGSRLSLGVIYRRLARLDEAWEQYENALALARAEGNAALECQAINLYGSAYWHIGEIRKARDLHEEGRRLCAAAREQLLRSRMRDEEPSILGNLGSDYQELGHLDDALRLFEEAGERAGELGLVRLRATSFLNQGTAYLSLGQPERARERYRRGLELYRSTADVSGQIRALVFLGWLDSSAGDNEGALEQFQEALALNSRVRLDPWIRGALLHAIGTALRERGDVAEAILRLDEALAVRRAARDRPGEAVTLNELAQAAIDRDLLPAARQYLEQALELSRGMDNRLLIAITLGRMARLSRRQGDPLTAATRISEALGLVETLRSEVAEPEMRATFLARRRSDYEFLIDQLMDLAAEAESTNPTAAATWRQEALHTSERARARSLIDLLAESRVDLEAGIDPALQQQKREVAARLSGTNRTLIDLSQAEGSDPLAPRRREDLLARRGELEEELGRLEREIRRQNAQAREIRHPEPLGLPEIRALLGPETALLEYALGEQRSFLFVITREDFACFPLAPAEELRIRVREARRGLEPGGGLSLANYLQQAHQLFVELVAPASDLLAGKSHLIIVPDDALFHLPFEALPSAPPWEMGPGEPIPYLVRRWSTSYVPSASVLKSLQTPNPEPAPGSPALIAFGDPVYRGLSAEEISEQRAAPGRGPIRRGQEQGIWGLPRLAASRQEVQRIGALFAPEPVLLYLDTEASEENVKGNPELARARHLHFAVHGLLGGDDGNRYGLVLDQSRSLPDPTEDGLLELREIFELRLDACDLVVLSACGSGLGREIRGEGFVGMSHAFLSAGAPSLVVSLWRVEDDSTAELMVRFYRNLLASGNKAEALRAARLEMLGETPYTQPQNWASFVLVGKPR